LTQHGVVRRDGADYVLEGHEEFTAEQAQELLALCESKLTEYVERRGRAIWEHRARGLSDVSGSVPGAQGCKVSLPSLWHLGRGACATGRPYSATQSRRDR
jgi:hypothetical protein